EAQRRLRPVRSLYARRSVCELGHSGIRTVSCYWIFLVRRSCRDWVLRISHGRKSGNWEVPASLMVCLLNRYHHPGDKLGSKTRTNSICRVAPVLPLRDENNERGSCVLGSESPPGHNRDPVTTHPKTSPSM